MEKRSVRIGDVPCFPWAVPDKEQALKPLEEAAEAYGAWQIWDDERLFEEDGAIRQMVVDECCDVIQAVCNLLSAMGVDDLSREMELCRSRNEAIGRFSMEMAARSHADVVRCRSCRNYDAGRSECWRVPVEGGGFMPARPDGFCSWGARR